MIELIPLRCPGCNAAITADGTSVLYYCSECGSGFEPGKDDALVKVPVYFARLREGATEFRPFWVFDAKAEVRKRESNKSLIQHVTKPKGLTRVFEERETIRFYVPAFTDDLQKKEPLALALTYEQRELEFLNKQPQFSSMMFSSEDARQIADFLFLTSEIEQPDMVRDLDYTLTLTNPFALSLAV